MVVAMIKPLNPKKLAIIKKSILKVASAPTSPLLFTKKLERAVTPITIRLTGWINFAVTAVSPMTIVPISNTKITALRF